MSRDIEVPSFIHIRTKVGQDVGKTQILWILGISDRAYTQVHKEISSLLKYGY